MFHLTCVSNGIYPGGAELLIGKPVIEELPTLYRTLLPNITVNC